MTSPSPSSSFVQGINKHTDNRYYNIYAESMSDYRCAFALLPVETEKFCDSQKFARICSSRLLSSSSPSPSSRCVPNMLVATNERGERIERPLAACTTVRLRLPLCSLRAVRALCIPSAKRAGDACLVQHQRHAAEASRRTSERARARAFSMVSRIGVVDAAQQH